MPEARVSTDVPKVVVAISGAPGGESLVRRGAQVAAHAGAELLGVHVRLEEGAPYPNDAGVAAHRALLQELGGTYHEVIGSDIGAVLAGFVRTHGAAEVVLGASRRTWWIRTTRGSVIGRVVRLAESVDIHVVSSRVAGQAGRALRNGRQVYSVRRQALAWAAAVAGLPLLTVVLASLRRDVGLSTGLLVYLLLVLAIAAIGGRVAAMVSTLAAVLLANWYLTPPLHTWSVSGTENLTGLLVFVAVAAIASAYISTAARRSLDAASARTEAETLAATAARAQVLEEANVLRAALLQAVSHDLRTPLSGIKVAVSTLRQPDVVWPENLQHEFLARIEADTDRLTALVTNLLDLSRIQAGAVQVKLRPVALEEVVPAALNSLDLAGCRVVVGTLADLPDVAADAGLLERVVANLVANAVEHSPPGTAVNVDARVDSSAIELRVIDNGPGIPAGDRESALRPFQRLGDSGKGKGVGLGLAIAHGFTTAMRGTLLLGDTAGGGLTALVRIPCFTVSSGP